MEEQLQFEHEIQENKGTCTPGKKNWLFKSEYFCFMSTYRIFAPEEDPGAWNSLDFNICIDFQTFDSHIWNILISKLKIFQIEILRYDSV